MSYRTARSTRAKNAPRKDLTVRARDINSWEINVAIRDTWNPKRPAERLGDAQALKAWVTGGVRFEAQDAIYRRRDDPLAYLQRLTPEARQEIISAIDDVIGRLTPQEPGRRK